jgi:fructokinase
MMISYDPNYRPTLWPDETTAHSKIFDGFKYAHLVKISAEEFHMATGHENIENGIRAVIDQGPDLVVVSRAGCTGKQWRLYCRESLRSNGV